MSERIGPTFSWILISVNQFKIEKIRFLVFRVCLFVCCFFLTTFLPHRDDINRAYRKLAVLIHPDKSLAPGSEDAFKALVNARAALLQSHR